MVGGIIIRKQNKITKNNNMMAFVTIEDLFGTIETIVFPKIYEECSDCIYEDNIVLIEGTLSMGEEDTPKIMCNKMTPLIKTDSTEPEKALRKPQRIYIKVTNREHYKSIKNDIFAAISASPGEDAVVIYSEREKANMVLPDKNRADAGSLALLSALKAVVGDDGVKVKAV